MLGMDGTFHRFAIALVVVALAASATPGAIRDTDDPYAPLWERLEDRPALVRYSGVVTRISAQRPEPRKYRVDAVSDRAAGRWAGTRISRNPPYEGQEQSWGFTGSAAWSAFSDPGGVRRVEIDPPRAREAREYEFMKEGLGLLVLIDAVRPMHHKLFSAVEPRPLRLLEDRPSGDGTDASVLLYEAHTDAGVFRFEYTVARPAAGDAALLASRVWNGDLLAIETEAVYAGDARVSLRSVEVRTYGPVRGPDGGTAHGVARVRRVEFDTIEFPESIPEDAFQPVVRDGDVVVNNLIDTADVRRDGEPTTAGISELTMDQLARVYDAGELRSDAEIQRVLARCRAVMGRGDAEGALAAMLHARVVIDDRSSRPGSAPQIAEALGTFLEHPGIGETMNSGTAYHFLVHIGSVADVNAPVSEGIGRCRESLIRVVRAAIDAEITDALASAPAMLSMLENHAGLPADEIESMRAGARDRVTALLASDGLDPGTRRRLEHARFGFDRDGIIAGLVGNPMPAMEILWSSDEDVDAFEDYRGKVLVLDFWATWCAPCIASFPHVRELRERYEGHDVAIVGVTSVQGRHYPRGSAPIDCEGDPEKEFGLMLEFMAEHDITWDVVFTAEPVFNREYAIEGIPHVVIIDPGGVVRHRALHPMDRGKPGKIDALLKEFGKAAPDS